MIALELDDASVTLGGGNLLREASFTVKHGQLTGLVGPNGAGKTTAVRALLGLQKLSSGQARIGGQCVTKLSPKQQALEVAYLPQTRHLAWPISVTEVIALGRFAYGTGIGRLSARDKAAVNDALVKCDLLAFAHRSVASLSGGELARVHIARALASGAPALIADEPTAALDPKHGFDVMELLHTKAREGGAVLVILHDLALAAHYCDEIIMMKGGRVVAQGPARDTLSGANVANVFGVTAHWDRDRLAISGAGPV